VAHPRGGGEAAVLAGLVGGSERWLIDMEGGCADLRVSDLIRLARALDALAASSSPAPPTS
jgi:hypothetical protein